ncbi:uncharacterized protein LOC130667219 [Microplitis mediator]|uniref:uncharacterized protein LOC130667219 n=1 Tax=Microplitis mediator TaxID=375433 RepID=UPI0025545B93|nr:uncharacterized protein LOC130667219 [Microplitis mediator]
MNYQYSDLMKWFCLFILLILLDIKNISVGKCMNDENSENLPSTYDEWYHLKHNITIRSPREAIDSLESTVTAALYQQRINEINKWLLDSLKNITKISEEIDTNYDEQLLHHLFNYKTNPVAAMKKYLDHTFKDLTYFDKLSLIGDWTRGLATNDLNSLQQNVFDFAIEYYSTLQVRY